MNSGSTFDDITPPSVERNLAAQVIAQAARLEDPMSHVPREYRTQAAIVFRQMGIDFDDGYEDQKPTAIATAMTDEEKHDPEAMTDIDLDDEDRKPPADTPDDDGGPSARPINNDQALPTDAEGEFTTVSSRNRRKGSKSPVTDPKSNSLAHALAGLGKTACAAFSPKAANQDSSPSTASDDSAKTSNRYHALGKDETGDFQ